MDAGMTGAIIGSLIGLIGGIAGTYASIRNTAGPKERSFVVRASFIVWIGGITFLLLLLLLPDPWRHLLWIPYAILLPLGIIKGNRGQQKIREEEADIHPTSHTATER